jgi:hypothetical protein
MIYCVVPRPLVDELHDKLVQRYADEQNVTVIVDRRVADRRARQARYRALPPAIRERRTVRDRRRARATGEMLPLATP